MVEREREEGGGWDRGKEEKEEEIEGGREEGRVRGKESG